MYRPVMGLHIFNDKNTLALQIVFPRSARIDVGSRKHIFAVDQNVENSRDYDL